MTGQERRLRLPGFVLGVGLGALAVAGLVIVRASARPATSAPAGEGP